MTYAYMISDTIILILCVTITKFYYYYYFEFPFFRLPISNLCGLTKRLRPLMYRRIYQNVNPNNMNIIVMKISRGNKGTIMCICCLDKKKGCHDLPSPPRKKCPMPSLLFCA